NTRKFHGISAAPAATLQDRRYDAPRSPYRHHTTTPCDTADSAIAECARRALSAFRAPLRNPAGAQSAPARLFRIDADESCRAYRAHNCRLRCENTVYGRPA